MNTFNESSDLPYIQRDPLSDYIPPGSGKTRLGSIQVPLSDDDTNRLLLLGAPLGSIQSDNLYMAIQRIIETTSK